MRGTVIDIVAAKGFFFLSGDGDKHYFAHRTDLPHGVRIEHLDTSSQFEFEVLETPRGLRATNLRAIPKQRSLDQLLAEEHD